MTDISSPTELSPRSKKTKLTLKNAPPEIQRALKERNNQPQEKLISSRRPFSTSPNMGGNLQNEWVKVDDRARTNSLLGADLVYWKNKETGQVTYENPTDTIAYYLHTDQSVSDKIANISVKVEKSSSSRHYIKFSSVFDSSSSASKNDKENTSYVSEKDKNNNNKNSLLGSSSSGNKKGPSSSSLSSSNGRNSKVSFLRSLFTRQPSSSSTASISSSSTSSAPPSPSTQNINHSKDNYSNNGNNEKREEDDGEEGLVYNINSRTLVKVNNDKNNQTLAAASTTTTDTNKNASSASEVMKGEVGRRPSEVFSTTGYITPPSASLSLSNHTPQQQQPLTDAFANHPTERKNSFSSWINISRTLTSGGLTKEDHRHIMAEQQQQLKRQTSSSALPVVVAASSPSADVEALRKMRQRNAAASSGSSGSSTATPSSTGSSSPVTIRNYVENFLLAPPRTKSSSRVNNAAVVQRTQSFPNQSSLALQQQKAQVKQQQPLTYAHPSSSLSSSSFAQTHKLHGLSQVKEGIESGSNMSDEGSIPSQSAREAEEFMVTKAQRTSSTPSLR